MLSSLRVCFFASIFLPATAFATLLPLSQAFDFNAYLIEDFTGYRSDVEGRLAVGRNLNVKHYAFGLELPGKINEPVVAVGNDATLRDARIYNGDLAVDGTVNINDSVGLYNGEDVQNANRVLYETAIDFGAINNDIIALSASWGALDINSTTEINKNDKDEIWNINFSASDSFNVFGVDASDLSALNKRITLDLPLNSLNVINVFGNDIHLTQTGFHLGSGEKYIDNDPRIIRHDGAYTNNVLFNFVDATEITLEGIGFKGSLLAPLADINFSNGHIDGNFIANSLFSDIGTETGQINDYQFGDIVRVTEPSMFVVIVVLAIVLSFKRRKLQSEAF